MSRRTSLLMVIALLSSTPAVSEGGWPWSSGPRRGSEAYYAQHACDPVGERQRCKHSKPWPPINRPVGEPQPFVHKYHSLHYWPWPYQLQDREDVRTVMAIQVANGWASSTTLYDYHFDPITHQLNTAGRSQLLWITQHVPPAYRQVYVSSAVESSINHTRTSSVQTSLAGLTGPDSALPISLRPADPLGRPASEVNQIFLNSASNALPPKIEYRSLSSSNTSN